MAAYSLEEQEKIDGLRAWWNKFGTVLVILLTVALFAMGGMKAWEYYQQKQAYQAADLYVLLQQIQASDDATKINDAAQLVMAGYPSSGYASRAAFITAQADEKNGNAKRALESLQWVVDHAKESSLRDLARLRIAGILLDEEKYDEALRAISVPHGDNFSGLYLDRKGDILVANHKFSEARLSYQEAIEKLNKTNNYYNIVQMKLDALGEVE
ncbi:putative negative regulator of RcsB-dependent stress response [Nitrosomonas sp. PY1]|uniref:YfgM family protein n=1 Tax=Nitrosomonas sp. PY1 TaxID=1803906 RepID=UPI001FC8895F|nr:tetratricopeptide repeat protein [Nitrosomonas sp. PY1]GKS69757.1 putative negative regulator of RcsB-dependent stress response [Nitrosomonas sp. PY1]